LHGLARLEEDVGVLGRAAQHRAVRAQRALAVGADEPLVDHRAQVVVGQQLDLVDLVRGAEAVEEVHEGHARLSVAAWAISAMSWPPGPSRRRASRSRSGGTAITSL
jgi:hypothetical protein